MTREDYIELINQEPTEVEQGDGYEHIKKSVLQQQLIEDFGGTDSWEMIRETVTKTGMYGVGRLSYIHPVSGAIVVKTGTAAIMHSDGKMAMDFPALEAMTFKNAAKKIGPRYGMLLNVDKEDQEPVTEIPTVNIKHESIIDHINACETTVELGTLKQQVPSELLPAYLKKLNELSKVDLKTPDNGTI